MSIVFSEFSRDTHDKMRDISWYSARIEIEDLALDIVRELEEEMQGLALVLALGWVILIVACTLLISGIRPLSRMSEWSIWLFPVPVVIIAVLLQLSVAWIIGSALIPSVVAALGYFLLRHCRLRLASTSKNAARLICRHRIITLSLAGLLLALGGLIFFSLA